MNRDFSAGPTRAEDSPAPPLVVGGERDSAVDVHLP